MQSFALGKGSATGITMPKLNGSFLLKNIVSPKLGRIMKLTVIILLIACMHVSAKGDAQNISLHENDAPLEKVLKSIEKQTNYTFFYRDEWLKQAKNITIKVDDIPLKQALDICFKDQPFNYTISEKIIVIKLKQSTRALNLDNNEITGRITDKSGNPIPGATIQIQNTSKVIISNERGEFTLQNANEGTVLIVSNIGYETTIHKITNGNSILIILKEKAHSLDETIVIAYGTTTKKLTTGNISTLKATEIEKQPVSNPILTLQGRVPGVNITQASGLPGAAISVRIQGQNSISQGNDPLYIIDGVPFVSQLLLTANPILTPGGSGGTTGSPLAFINPSDIESIDILKDADATAIFGSRAANGAIIITTKKGKAGKTQFALNCQTGWAKVTRTLPLLNTREYLEMRREGFKNDGLNPRATDYDVNGVWDTTKYTDWQKTLIGGTAKYTDLQSSITGGNGNTNFLISQSFHRETTVFPGNLSDQKFSTHINFGHTSSNQKLNISLTTNYLIDDNRLNTIDLTSIAIGLVPNAPDLYNEDGSLNWAPLSNGNSSWRNPLSFLNNKYQNKSTNLISNALIGYAIIPGLEVKASIGYNRITSNETVTFPIVRLAPELRQNGTRSSTFGYSAISSINIEPQISYKRKISKGNLEFLIGSTYLKMVGNSQIYDASGFNSDLVMEDVKSAPTLVASQSVSSVYKYSALFSRINFNWDSKYLINLTGRRDGSSRYGNNNKFHNFTSVGLGWIFTNESFLKKEQNFLSFGKIRSSIGTTGNDNIGDYKYLNLFNSFPVETPYQGTAGLTPVGIPNPNLQWEQTIKFQSGLDLGFFSDKIILAINYYRNESNNQLVSYSLPYTSGFPAVQINLPAEVRNTGFELSINSTNIKNKSFVWNTNFNLTIPRNKLVSYPNFQSSTLYSSLALGAPLTLRKTYKTIGVDPATGLHQFVDANNNISDILNFSTDRVNLTNIGPRAFGGIQNSISFKDFSLDILFQFVKQTANSNYVLGNMPGFFSSRASASSTSAVGNQPIWVLDRWKKPGDVAQNQKFSATYPTAVVRPYGYAGSSNIVTSDASFIRLKNISISYQIPNRWKNSSPLKSGKIFMHAQNLLTITKFKGLDPEIRGNNSLPPLKIISVGINVTI